MADQQNEINGAERSPEFVYQVGFYAALLTAILTVITFGFAMIAIPISGANCPADCITYPYLDTIAQFPRDYLWMPLAMLLMLAYVVLMAAIHAYAVPNKKLFGQVGLSFALMSALVLLIAYYTQFSVVPVSLVNAETEGIALLTQYNSHGLFIALEELGYLLMALSFLAVAPVFAGRTRLESAARWIFVAGFGLTLLSLVVVSALYGLERLDRFEVFAISITWLVLIANGVILSIVFRRHLHRHLAQQRLPQTGP